MPILRMQLPSLQFTCDRVSNYAIAVCVLALSVLCAPAAHAARDASPIGDIANPPASITSADVDEAIVKVKADPNLAHEKTIRTLRWNSDDKEKPKRKPTRLGWLGDFLRFIAQTGRVIVWLIIGVAVALLVVAIIKIVRSIEPSHRAAPFNAPTHVRDLDIRPESLPDDIGAAALALWEQGEHRAALALLYRGLLSRLVHVHAVPIRHSSTEGDCLNLAMERMQAERSTYVGQVIRVWQRAVYGAQSPQNSDVQSLCAGFADALNKTTTTSAP